MCLQKANHAWLSLSLPPSLPPTIWVVRKKSVHLFINFKIYPLGKTQNSLVTSLQNISNFKTEVSFTEYQKSWLMPFNISISLSYLSSEHTNWRKSYSLVNHRITILLWPVVPFWRDTLLKLKISVKNPKSYAGYFVKCSPCKYNNHGGAPLPQKKMDFTVLGEA